MIEEAARAYFDYAISNRAIEVSRYPGYGVSFSEYPTIAGHNRAAWIEAMNLFEAGTKEFGPVAFRNAVTKCTEQWFSEQDEILRQQ